MVKADAGNDNNIVLSWQINAKESDKPQTALGGELPQQASEAGWLI